ncbi:TRAP-type mannitol/chloroaromatic compound transport system permease small subunit [Vogesella indigofera]|uniref:TRAP transporter small permease protein n=1 Tax=Vogesella indigofera TaxID=45465 RepID=A0A495B949_VOGIN|nr:TRAP-type mannitol/chloroaromatic compound transport system permease small subunit [Vogesella indigofera]
MQLLLALSRLIDAINARIGQAASWLVLVVVLISAGNAVVRKLFNISSNGLLEIQWYLFSAIFLLAAAYTLQKNEHIRIDLLVGKLSERGQAVVDIVGTLLFLMPVCYLLISFGWPMFIDAWNSGEMSSDAGGLVRWPVFLLIPVGFALLMAQGLSELIKRVAFLQGLIPNPAIKSNDPHKEPA